MSTGSKKDPEGMTGAYTLLRLDIPLQKMEYGFKIEFRIIVAGSAVPCPIHDKKFFFCRAGVIKLIYHIRSYKIIFGTMDKQNRHDVFFHL